jgi:uncharacterized membrane protein YdbT with pleckstrin-like domain
MEILDDMLVPGEKVTQISRFSIWTIGWLLVRDGLFMIVAVALLWFESSRWFGVAAASFALIEFTWGIARFWNNRIWLTDRRLIAQTGWPGRNILDFPYNRFESAKVEQSLLGRMFDFGDVEISGVGSTVAHLRLIGSPLRFKRSLEMAKGSTTSSGANPS